MKNQVFFVKDNFASSHRATAAADPYAFGSNMIISAIRMFKALTLKAFGIDADWQLLEL